MEARWTPMRWPDSWKNPALLDLLKGTVVDTILFGQAEDLGPVRIRAQRDGFQIGAPQGVSILKGEWPGARISRGRNAGAGPTGVPWVDSNGWAIRLRLALHPDSAVWVEAAPHPETFITPDSYLIAVADAAAHGGRWIIALDTALADSLAAGKPDAQKPWKRLLESASFFAAHKSWSAYETAANIGVASDFAGPNEFFAQELLNLLARAGAHARAIPPGGSFEGLRAVIYPDSAPVSAALRRQLDAFVKEGGLVMSSETRPPDDPYVWANDAVILMSHRYDMVRFWNGGACGSFFTKSPGGDRGLVHLLFYSMRGPDAASVRIAGRYRSARAATVEHAELANLQTVALNGAMEVHLPPVSQYVALQLE